jgi:hypothetical protein
MNESQFEAWITEEFGADVSNIYHEQALKKKLVASQRVALLKTVLVQHAAKLPRVRGSTRYNSIVRGKFQP